MTAIATRNLSRSYGARRGIVDVELDVSEGSLFGFLGPNGAGKTTTIRVLLGFLKPSAGTAEVFGHDCWRDGPAVRADVGYLPGDFRPYPWLTVADGLRIVGGARGRDLRGDGLALAERLAIDVDVPARSMSRGMRQKLGLVLALAHRPRLLVLDEPTAGLDPLMQIELKALLRETAAAGGTVFFSSHSLSEVEELCDRAAIVRDGRIAADATLADLRATAGHEVTILWREAPGTEAPPFLALLDASDRTWKARLDGTPVELVEWLAARPFADLTIGRPDLESVFRRFYEPGGAT